MVRLNVLNSVVVLAFGIHATPEVWAANCNSTQNRSTNLTMSEDYVKEAGFGATPCFNLSGGVVLNMNGFSIICDDPNGCSTAVATSSVPGTVVKNGFIVSDAGDWDKGINNISTVQNVTIENANVAVYHPQDKIEHCVFKNIADACILSDGQAVGSSLDVTQNFCDSAGLGFSIKGSGVGSETIRRNYVRAAGGAGIVSEANTMTYTQNIIDEGTPYIDNTGSPTLVENICDDASDCPLPGSNFDLTPILFRKVAVHRGAVPPRRRAPRHSPHSLALGSAGEYRGSGRTSHVLDQIGRYFVEFWAPTRKSTREGPSRWFDRDNGCPGACSNCNLRSGRAFAGHLAG